MNTLKRIFIFGLIVLSSQAIGKGNLYRLPRLDSWAPLGTRENPVRASMPIGEQDFFMRLRCPEGDAPTFERQGSIGTGPYGNVLDSYRATCRSGKTSTIIIDMYHQHREMRDINGFTTLPEHPARLAAGCPPKVEGAATGVYVFNRLEVERPAHVTALNTELESDNFDGYVHVNFVIGIDGKVSPETIEYARHDLDANLKEIIFRYLQSLQFTPAEQRIGCPVPQKGGVNFRVKRR